MKPIAKVGIGCLVVFVTCIGGIGILAFRIASAKVNPSTDYAGQIEELVIREQAAKADQPNRWPELLALLDRSTTISTELWNKHKGETADEGSLKMLDTSILRGSEPVGDRVKEEAAARELLMALSDKQIFGDLSKLSTSGRYVRPLPKGRPLMEAVLPDLPQARGLTRALAGQMRETHRQGKYGEYLEAFAGGCALGRIYLHQPTTIDRLVGIAMLTLMLDELKEGNIEKPLPAEVLAECRRIIDAHASIPSIRISLQTERLFIKDTIQWTFSDSGNGDGWFIPSAAAKMGVSPIGVAGAGNPFTNFAGIAVVGRKETTEKIDEYFDKMLIYAALPRSARQVNAFQPDAEVVKLSDRYKILKVLLPALGAGIVADDRLRFNFTGTRVVIAIEEHMRAHGGEPPATLAELTPTYLAEVPIDLISSQPYGYKVFKAGEDPAGRRYLLYSIGGDGKDDGGKQAPSKDRHVATKSPGQAMVGVDFVINEPDEAIRKRIPGEQTAPTR